MEGDLESRATTVAVVTTVLVKPTIVKLVTLVVVLALTIFGSSGVPDPTQVGRRLSSGHRI